MGLRGEKIEDKALAKRWRTYSKAISEIAPRSDSPKRATKSEPWRTGQHLADNIRVTKAKMEDGIKRLKLV